MGHSQAVRRVGGPAQWKTETDLRSGAPIGGMYSSQPPHRTIIREELSAPIGAGRSPVIGPESGAGDVTWEKIMTFRTFVIDRVSFGTNSWEFLFVLKKRTQFRIWVLLSITLCYQVSEETESDNAVTAYNQYKQNFKRGYTARLFRQLKVSPHIGQCEKLNIMSVSEYSSSCFLHLSFF